MPPWISRDKRLLVPPATSLLSTRATRTPRSAASCAMPAPVIPPPMISTSSGSAAIASSAAARVWNENGVSPGNSPPVVAGGRFRTSQHTSGPENVMPTGNGRRVAVVAGCRTPFCRAGSVLKHVRAMDLARHAARELLERTNLAGDDVDEAVWGQVVPSRLRPRHLVPVTPAIAEPSTGMSMGQSAEKMAKENGISREAQDRWALRSHQRAAQGTSDGRLTAEIVPWFPTREGDSIVTADNGIRTDTSLEQMGKLKPVFDRRYGSVTAANSSPLTDGASAVLLMSEEKARALGYEPLAYIRAYAVAAVDPGWQLLQAPVKAVPLALQRAGIQWKELGLIEIHEAFAAQVLSNLKGFEEELGWEIDEEIINVMGGSIAIGHPFGATGGRLVTTLANEMRRRDVQFGLISVCAQGGMASAVVLERR